MAYDETVTSMQETSQTQADTETPRLMRWLSLFALVFMVVLLPALGAMGLAGPWREQIEQLSDAPLWTCGLFVIGCALLAGFALVPTHAVSLLAGYLYGFWIGLAAALLSVFFATALGYTLVRRLSPDALRAEVERTKVGKILLARLIDAKERDATLAVALVRLPPQVPFALGNVLAASLGVRRLPLLLGTLLGMLPRIAIVVWLGSTLSAWQPGESSYVLAILAVIAALVGLGGLSWWSWRVLRSSQVKG